MKQLDANIRIFLAFVVLIVAVYTTCYILALLSVILLYTGIKKECFLYKLFDINKRFSMQNYYRSLLPLHNPSAVFIFDAKDKCVFKNSAAQEVFGSVESLIDLTTNNKESSFSREIGEKTYQINTVNAKNEGFVLAYSSDISESIELAKEIEHTQKEVIYAMGEIGETRSKETGNHVKRVTEYSYLLANLYQLSESEALRLKMASPMHDIGKVGISDAILKKEGKLDEDEFRTMKTHAKLGYNMLKKSNKPILQAAAIVAHEHHEKWDGSGYPRGISGEDIHIFGRITAVADVFDALGSKRVYKEAWELEDILTLFREQKGKHFDPTLVDLFFANLDQFIAIRDRYKDS
jgi:response regulator RpfG family c-di-GMP phosphodiesterase